MESHDREQSIEKTVHRSVPGTIWLTGCIVVKLEDQLPSVNSFKCLGSGYSGVSGNDVDRRITAT